MWPLDKQKDKMFFSQEAAIRDGEKWECSFVRDPIHAWIGTVNVVKHFVPI